MKNPQEIVFERDLSVSTMRSLMRTLANDLPRRLEDIDVVRIGFSARGQGTFETGKGLVTEARGQPLTPYAFSGEFIFIQGGKEAVAILPYEGILPNAFQPMYSGLKVDLGDHDEIYTNALRESVFALLE